MQHLSRSREEAGLVDAEQPGERGRPPRGERHLLLPELQHGQHLRLHLRPAQPLPDDAQRRHIQPADWRAHVPHEQSQLEGRAAEPDRLPPPARARRGRQHRGPGSLHQIETDVRSLHRRGSLWRCWCRVGLRRGSVGVTERLQRRDDLARLCVCPHAPPLGDLLQLSPREQAQVFVLCRRQVHGCTGHACWRPDAAIPSTELRDED
mmetsp:Transcript_11887/g.38886  ORF Transcript_11887/g.38886 Transcript_11887/m.38886 type:complete len:207 (-) Transcript_11887:297-917(-)